MKDFLPQNAYLYMRYNKVLPSAQGMAIYGNLAFILHHTGVCAVYDLKTKESKCIVSFPLGSYNDGAEGEEYINHSNQCMFSDVFLDGNDIPLLYVTTGNRGGGDEDGYYYRCAVENIKLERNREGKIVSASSELIQTVSYINCGIEDTKWETPCWGCPAWFVDNEKKCMYMFSARYRTTDEFLQYREINRYIITKFPLPDINGAKFVKLTAADILDQFTAPFDILFTQGGMICGNKLFYTFGLGDSRYPIGLRAYDLDRKCLCAQMDLSSSVLGREEIESSSFYNGELLCNTNAEPGGIFSLGGEIKKELFDDGE